MFLAGSHEAGAFDTFSGVQLSIPSVSIRGATFSNMVVTLGGIVSGPTGAAPTAPQHSCNPVNNQDS